MDIRLLGLTFVVATVVTAIELMTSTYPRTAGFVVKSRWFYGYILIYGVLGAAALALLPPVGSEVTMTGVGVDNPWVKAALVGFSVKAFLHIRVFTVSTAPNQSFPVGLETFVQLFEPWMLTSLDLDHFMEQQAFIRPRATRQVDLKTAQNAALNSFPTGYSAMVATGFKADVSACTTPTEVISTYLKYCGTRLTAATFP